MRLKKPAAAKGTLLDRWVTVPLGAPLDGGIAWAIGGEISLPLAIFRRRQRRRIKISTRMIARPASPPTTPPTTVEVGGVLLPPDPAPELAVDEGAVPVGLPEVPLMPPGRTPVLELVLELRLLVLDDRMEDPEVEEVLLVDEESVIVEIICDLVLESVPVRVPDEEELVVDVIRVELEPGVARVRLVAPFDPELGCKDVKAERAR